MKVIKANFSGGGLGHGNGSNCGPDAIEKACKDVYANESGVACSFEFIDCNCDENNISESHEKIEQTVSSLTEYGVILGGDHSITFPAVKGFAKHNPDFKFIVFDAHPDLMDHFVPPSQEDYLRSLIEEGVVKSENVLIVGIRNWDSEEIRYLQEKSISYIHMKTVYEKDWKQIVEEIVAFCDSDSYLSIDIDVVDPIEAVGTGYLEHGGISSRELIYAIQQLILTNNVQMADLVEINPSKDVQGLTVSLGAKILAELCK